MLPRCGLLWLFLIRAVLFCQLIVLILNYTFANGPKPIEVGGHNKFCEINKHCLSNFIFNGHVAGIFAFFKKKTF